MIGGEIRGAQVTSRRPRQSVWYAGHLFTVLATAAETNGRFSLVEELAWHGSSLALPLRIQTRESVCTYVIAGEVTVEVDHEALSVAAGVCITIPLGVAHRFASVSDAVQLVHIYTPGGFDGFFRDLGEPAESLTQPATRVAPLNVERLVTIAAKYGVEIVAPPPNDEGKTIERLAAIPPTGR